MKEKADLLFDVRVVERNIQEGIITREEYEEYLRKLPDVSDKGCPLIIEDEENRETQEEIR
ncbi:MAG: hypothetical protein KatS3mg078_1594 [Deltaproteobacteria bacterium]|jgi:hypothetical protein|nr:MAG: hypothetical protein KatS3mg078_1594 [Deltaproteobacteria bacterium]